MSASAVSVSLTGLNSGFQTVETSVHARTGSLILEVGAEANLLMIERLVPGPTYALSAGTSVEIRGGRKFLPTGVYFLIPAVLLRPLEHGYGLRCKRIAS